MMLRGGLALLQHTDVPRFLAFFFVFSVLLLCSASRFLLLAFSLSSSRFLLLAFFFSLSSSLFFFSVHLLAFFFPVLLLCASSLCFRPNCRQKCAKVF